MFFIIVAVLQLTKLHASGEGNSIIDAIEEEGVVDGEDYRMVIPPSKMCSCKLPPIQNLFDVTILCCRDLYARSKETMCGHSTEPV